MRILRDLTNNCELEQNDDNIKIVTLHEIIEHIKIRISLINPFNLMDTDEYNREILLDRMIRYFEDDEACRTEEIITGNHIKDLLVLLMVQFRAAEEVGIDKMAQYFDKLLELNVSDKKLYQSIKVNHHLFLSGDKRISELEKIESEAHSTFLKGLINYFIGMSLEHSHDERNIRILNAISIFKGTDEIRLASCLHALIQGAVDRRDDRGNPTRVVPQGNDLLEPLPRLENILKTLSDYDEEVTKIVMYEVEDYLIHRICGYRQTNRNDYPLIFQQKFQMVATVPQIRSLYNSLELLLEENSRS